jgi:hypothetical protein
MLKSVNFIDIILSNVKKITKPATQTMKNQRRSQHEV